MPFNFGDIIWLLVILAFVIPWVRQWFLDRARLRMIRKIERQRKSRVILLVHRQETITFLGLPIFTQELPGPRDPRPPFPGRGGPPELDET